MTTPHPLSGHVALVTGGSGDIGAATCRRLAAAGATVIVNFRSSEEAARTVLDSLPGAGHSLIHAAVDKSEDVQRMADFVAERYGRLDILVNNAGFTRFVDHADLDALDDDLIDRIFQTNWRGAFACIRACKDLLMADEGGVVINISSIAGRTGLGSNVAYCASKAALDSMTRSLGRALAPQIRVVSVSPGLVDGPYAASFDRAFIAEQTRRTPLGRLVTAEDVADTIYAVIVHMPMLTGTDVHVDGGRPLT
jgi:3-oxoacyl-[acyl-carrier protein] reductase